MRKIVFRQQKSIPVILAAIFCVFLLLLGLSSVFSADDYWYSTFLNDGFIPWIKKMLYHYKTVNGRTFVHLCATIILRFDKWLFALVLIAAGLLAGFSLWRGPSRKRHLFMSFFTGGLLLIARPIMVEGVLWISGFCNYFIPTLLAVLLFRKTRWMILENSVTQKRFVGLIVLSFLCGATTEQIGLSAIALLSVLAFESWKEKHRKALRLCFIQIAFCVAGTATIFLSPATRNRLENETSAAIDQLVLKGLAAQGNLVLDCPSLVVLIALIPILIFLISPRYKKELLFAGVSVWTELCLVCVLIRDEKTIGFFYGGMLLGLFLLSGLCWITKRRDIGSLLFFACTTAVVMLFTQSSGYRSLLPMNLILLALACQIILEQKRITSKVFINRVMLVLVIFIAGKMIHDIPNYRENVRIDHLNQVYARIAETGGPLYYCMDYSESYTHSKAFSTGYFKGTYLESIGIDEPEHPMYFYSSKLPLVRINGHRAESPAIQDAKGNWFLPLRDVVEAMGGTLTWDKETETVFTLNEQKYSMSSADGAYKLKWSDAAGDHVVDIPQAQDRPYYAICLPVHVYKGIFGLQVDLSDRAIFVTASKEETP